jgi:DNA-binding transcriptional regulator YdaS (Cro superfamily)
MTSIKEQIEQQEKEQLEAAVAWAGSASVLASLLDVTPQVVHGWIKRGRISATSADVLEKITNGKFKRSEMRPDVKDWYL